MNETLQSEALQLHLNREEIKRYSRHLLLPEIALQGQKRFKAARVAVTGTNAASLTLLSYLTCAGVGTLAHPLWGEQQSRLLPRPLASLNPRLRQTPLPESLCSPPTPFPFHLLILPFHPEPIPIPEQTTALAAWLEKDRIFAKTFGPKDLTPPSPPLHTLPSATLELWGSLLATEALKLLSEAPRRLRKTLNQHVTKPLECVQ